MLLKLKEFWSRFKWYFIVITFIILCVLAFVFTHGEDDTSKDLTKWMLNNKIKSDKKKLETFTKMSNKTEEDIRKVQDEIKETRKVYKEIDKEVENRDVAELSEAFKRLGY